MGVCISKQRPGANRGCPSRKTMDRGAFATEIWQRVGHETCPCCFVALGEETKHSSADGVEVHVFCACRHIIHSSCVAPDTHACPVCHVPDPHQCIMWFPVARHRHWLWGDAMFPACRSSTGAYTDDMVSQSRSDADVTGDILRDTCAVCVLPLAGKRHNPPGVASVIRMGTCDHLAHSSCACSSDAATRALCCPSCRKAFGRVQFFHIPFEYIAAAAATAAADTEPVAHRTRSKCE